MQKTNTQTNEKKKTKKKRKLPEMISEKHFTQLLSGKTMLRHLIKMRTGKILDENHNKNTGIGLHYKQVYNLSV